MLEDIDVRIAVAGGKGLTTECQYSAGSGYEPSALTTELRAVSKAIYSGLVEKLPTNQPLDLATFTKPLYLEYNGLDP